jgi:hypothetical protein
MGCRRRHGRRRSELASRIEHRHGRLLREVLQAALRLRSLLRCRYPGGIRSRLSSFCGRLCLQCLPEAFRTSLRKCRRNLRAGHHIASSATCAARPWSHRGESTYATESKESAENYSAIQHVADHRRFEVISSHSIPPLSQLQTVSGPISGSNFAYHLDGNTL